MLQRSYLSIDDSAIKNLAFPCYPHHQSLAGPPDFASNGALTGFRSERYICAPMAIENENRPPAVLKALKGSGFPFQTVVAHVIRTTGGWAVHASEYPWLGPKNDNCFLDIVAVGKRFVLNIECKKTQHDIFTFLLPLGDRSTGHVEEFRCLRVERYADVYERMRVYCEDWNLRPVSPLCEFCIVGSATSGSQRMLEKDAGELIGATDAFAKDVQEFHRVTIPAPYAVIPVIVTNARMYTARYEPTEVSLETGEFQGWPRDMEREVPWIRFHKTFLAGRGRDVGTRSIFVVNSMHFKEFLEKLEAAPTQPTEKSSVSLS
jgi:hypothetical protein